MAEIMPQIYRDLSTLEKEFALHCQATGYQFNEINIELIEVRDRLKVIENRKAPASILPMLIEFIISPKTIKWAIGVSSGAGGVILSRLIG